MDDTTIHAYKGFDKDLRCRDFQYEVGKTYEHVGPVRACGSGFHACENPLDVWAYYPVNQSRFCKVTLSGTLSRDGDDSKVAAAKITLDAEIGMPGIITAAVQYMLALVKDAFATPSKVDAPTEGDASGYSARIGSSGDSARIGSSGDSARIGSSGNSAQIGSSGNSAQIGSSGDSARIGSSGDSARIGSSGDSAQIGSSGDSARIGSSGDSAQIGSSGNSAQIGSSGNSARIGSSGYSARIGSSGYSAQIGSSGDSARIGSSGDSAQIDATGENAVIAAAGVDTQFKVAKGGSVSIAYRDAAERVRFAVGYEGEGLAADTWYRVDNAGQFVEVSE
ncbi:DUF7666 domain-containing protein [Burkholderia seminalis]|uniref:DUF7666 domain-containing protein n=1 Tax=Burkholderia seminalis TaxID=488731 RepID=UPI000F5A51A7|nr:hypothetical protein [Burkholderia seminalis]RQS79771.1 hypothetical protein DF032_14460 [Burkholderia seminalis]